MARSSADVTALLGAYDFICAYCAADVFEGELFCKACLKGVKLNDGKTCLKCGAAIDGEQDYCSKCGKRSVFFDRAYSLYLFEGHVRKVIHRLKYAKERHFVPNLAKEMANYIKEKGESFDCVTYVPMDGASQRERGYNQSYLLAAALCDILDKGAPQTLLTKVKATAKQEELDFTQRLKNLQGAFKAVNKEIIKGKDILLIDDVLTTGATASFCAKALKGAGAKRVIVLTLASRKEIISTGVKDERTGRSK